MRFIRGDTLKEAIERFHGDETLKNSPGQRACVAQALGRPGRMQCDRLCPLARRASSRHQAGQYHRGQTWRDAGGRLGTGQGPRPVRPRVCRTNAGSEILRQRLVRDSAGLGAGHAGLYEPEQDEGTSSNSAPAPMSTASTRFFTFCSPASRRSKATTSVVLRRARGKVPAAQEDTRRSTNHWRRSV